MDAAQTQLPSALERLQDFRQRLESRRAIVFLDYDGTLTPIASRPELARITPEMRALVGALAERCPVSIVSGRATETLREFLRLENVIYAGSHGMVIDGPPGTDLQLEIGQEYLEELTTVHRRLTSALSGIPGVLVQLTGYTAPVHFRLVPPERIPEVERIVERVTQDHPGIRVNRGKMVFEIRPDVAWDKGKALLWIREQLGLNPENSVAFYLGDDTTDEDAFAVLDDRDAGILVASEPRETAARYLLRDPSEVGRFLEGLVDIINAPTEEARI